jgi:serine/threonine-protein kinase HipA
MVKIARVKIWDYEVGVAAWDQELGVATFEYADPFKNLSIELSPIKMPTQSNGIFTFPENRRTFNEESTFNGLPGLLADSLPDKYGNRLINAWLAYNGREENSMNPVEKLCFIGERGMGALEFEPVLFDKSDQQTGIEISNLVDAAKKILSTKANFKTQIDQDGLKSILKIGSSAGGARPKAIISFNETNGKVLSGQVPAPKNYEPYLIKLDGVSDAQFGESSGYGRVEMAYYMMAIDSGINMMPSRLIEENGRAHFMTKRYDRTAEGAKIHVQSFCALCHYDYNNVLSYSYEQLFQAMRRLKLPYSAAREMFGRMVFNILSRNCDDHTKNFSFLLTKNGHWQLAPAYDLCHAYRPNSTWVSQHALSVNGKRKDHNKQDILALAESINIQDANEIVDSISTVVGNWKIYAECAGVNQDLRQAIEKTLVKI